MTALTQTPSDTEPVPKPPMRMISVPIIDNDEVLEWAFEEIATLMQEHPPVGSERGAYLLTLMLVVEAYEQEHYPIDPPDPVETVLAAMEERGATRGELAKILGGASRVSEFLNRKRNLTKTMIRRLHEEWSIPLEVLVQESREG
jgi:HTH-type transcriptional regulator/antitoxin HigA